ncbi:DUF1853 family protein [Pseudofulvibacter geojedonensis]|uniref:DUF1853 family protein n=1 Tax=Pseudofulvibacter geojedonensis TaxID=1123758 RepID=A0ABW3HYS5_9FLAO
MTIISKNIPQQYQGFALTPLLWNNEAIYNLKQLDIATEFTSSVSINIPQNLMLGKRVERFTSHLLQQNKDIDILQENIQINHNKITVGELDCLLMHNDTPTHIEVVYKFYLYDDSVGNTELDHLIGPNRKDSLVEKLVKLQQKQLPLLFRPETKPVLDKLGYLATSFKQRVYFKAQVFLPINQPNIRFKKLNNDCIIGFYARIEELNDYHSAKFYIPKKVDWLIIPHQHINWINFETFNAEVESHLSKQKSPMCWMKKTNGELLKFFVVWW